MKNETTLNHETPPIANVLLVAGTDFKEEALLIISDLLDNIGWLGGDSYEMEAIENSTNIAQDFLDKHKTIKEDTSDLKLKHMTGGSFGIYCHKERQVEACNKKVAAKYMGVSPNSVRCIKEPYK